MSIQYKRICNYLYEFFKKLSKKNKIITNYTKMKQLIMMFNSFKIKPIIFLVILPLCYSFTFYALPIIPNSNPLYLFIPLIFVSISIEYVQKPLKSNAKTFFYKYGLDRTIHDYNFLAILLSVLICLTIAFNYITRTWFMTNLDWENYFLTPEYYFNSLTTGLGIMTLATSIRYGLLFLKKNTKYNLAKICFQLCSEKSDEIQQIKLLRLGVHYYGQFIKRTSNIKIQDTGMIYSKFISYNKTDKKTKINSIVKSFEKESVHEPFKQLKKSFDIKDESITESKLIDELKRWAPTIIGAIIGGYTAITQNMDVITKTIGSFFGLNSP